MSDGSVTKSKAKTRRPHARHLPFCKVADDGGGALYHCALCASYLPEAAFLASAIAHRTPNCRACCQRRLLQTRHQSMDHEAAIALYNMEHTRFGRKGIVPVALVTAMLDAGGRCSAMSGATERLRIRRFWEDLPLSVENAVILTVEENRRMTNKSEAARLALFPAELVARMQAWRAAQLVVDDQSQSNH
jgi:DNA-directed RNA polymerase subunit RPC12/RpoP